MLRKKTPPRFNVNFEIIINEKKKNRYILVSSQTTIKEVIDVIFSIEGLDGADRPKYALYREAIDSQKKKARYFELTETPFDITDSLSKFSFRDVVSVG